MKAEVSLTLRRWPRDEDDAAADVGDGGSDASAAAAAEEDGGGGVIDADEDDAEAKKVGAGSPSDAVRAATGLRRGAELLIDVRLAPKPLPDAPSCLSPISSHQLYSSIPLSSSSEKKSSFQCSNARKLGKIR